MLQIPFLRKIESCNIFYLFRSYIMIKYCFHNLLLYKANLAGSRAIPMGILRLSTNIATCFSKPLPRWL